jgi:hypothetical protein
MALDQVKFVLFITLVLFLGSCAESFKSVDPVKFNAQIAGRTDIGTPEDLMLLYYGGKPDNEGLKFFSITSEKNSDSDYEITLIHDGLADDSIAGINLS